MSEQLFQYSIVVPVYNSGKVVQTLLTGIYQHMSGQGAFEVILVDDSSTDDTWKQLKAIHPGFENLKIVRLSKNFGQAAATLCGIYRAKGEAIITMDDDLQYPPSELPRLIGYFSKHDYYMVLGLPQKKRQPWSYLISEQLIRLFFRLYQVGHLNGKNISSSFRIFKSDLNFSEDLPLGRVYSIHMATLMISPIHIGELSVEHRPSTLKKSRYSFFGRLKGFLQLLLEFNVSPMDLLKVPLLLLFVTALAIWLFLGYTSLTYHLPTLIFLLGGLLAMGQLMQAWYLRQINARQLGMAPYLVIEEHG
ncbi:MAG: glycosyltransferase [Roseivirga sp.]|nr:glycosyltransferase [Roseivirga sp.]